MNQKPWLTLTSLLALTLGVVIATWLVPMWRTTDRIHDVASDDFDQRKAAWNWWRSEPAPLPMMELNRALSNASPEALLHGARELQDLNAWGWGKQTHTLMARYMTLLLWRSHIMDAHDVILLVDQAPSDAPADAMLEVGGVLFKHSDPAVANLGFNALVSWCGFRPVLSEMLTQLPPQRADWGLHFHHLLEHGQQPLRIRSMLNDPDALQQRLAEWNANLTDQDVLLLSSVRTATTSGDAHQRRSTAQRWLNDRDAQTRPMPADDPPPGSQRRLAGALLAAHERLDPLMIEEAMIVEDDAVARTVMRLAIDALGPAWNGDDPAEFARRALPVSDGVSLYPLFCRMLAGDLSLLEPLLESAATGSWPARFQAIALISWLLPDWIDAELNMAAETTQVDIFFERLLARWRLGHRWVVNLANSTDDVSHD